MRLTLGALAALEAALDTGSLVEMVDRFERGAFQGRDLMLLLWAGLNGGGWDVPLEKVASAHVQGGPIKAAKLGAQLLALTFSEDAP